MLGNAGVIINPNKFQFCEKTIDFAGFRISDSEIEPLPKYLDTIRHFPTPKNISDIRSWFGLVNQVSNYGQLRDIMKPFKQFLSPRHPFTWNPDLDAKFIESKKLIVDAICKGVEIFDVLAYDQTGPVKGSVTTYLKSIVLVCQQCQVVVRMAGK